MAVGTGGSQDIPRGTERYGTRGILDYFHRRTTNFKEKIVSQNGDFGLLLQLISKQRIGFFRGVSVAKRNGRRLFIVRLSWSSLPLTRQTAKSVALLLEAGRERQTVQREGRTP